MPSSGPAEEAPTDADVELEARVRFWDDTRIVIDYTLFNAGEVDRIAFDASSSSLQSELSGEGRLRLFKGKQDTGDTAFYILPTIEGRRLDRARPLEGSGSRRMPLRTDFTLDPARHRPVAARARHLGDDARARAGEDVVVDAERRVSVARGEHELLDGHPLSL